MTTAEQHPPDELLSRICGYVYSACIPSRFHNLDPLLVGNDDTPTHLPSSFPSQNWAEIDSRRALANLCLLNHAWYEAAKPWLWRKLEVRLPRSWLALVEQVAWNYDEETVDQVMEQTVKAAAKAATQASGQQECELAQKLMEECILDEMKLPDESIPLELLSPMASREPSPIRFRHKSKSPARWELVRSISHAVQDLMERREPSVYVPFPHDPRPGRFVHHIDFNHFRTIGMRRSVEEGVNSRFVTGDRVEAILKETPNLTVFGATDYMDGSLTLPVLNELFLRGSPSRGRGRPSRGRTVVDGSDAESEDRERRRHCKDLEAIDLTGCISGIFVNALSEFVATHLRPTENPQTEALQFPAMERLGLRGVKSVTADVLTPFVLSFPSLTHLDLSGTRTTTDLLHALGSTSVRLQSLALSRCVLLTGSSIRDFLVESPVTAGLTELNLYGDATFPSPLSAQDLRDMFTKAPAFVQGDLVYLDLSSAPISDQLISKDLPALPRMRSLGISHIQDLNIQAVADYLLNKAPNVEIVTLVGTSPQLDCGLRLGAPGHVRGSMLQSSIALHTHVVRPLCHAPFSLDETKEPRTSLRVIELSMTMLGALGAGAGNWRIIKSKGGRGWYVDTACGWVNGTLKRDMAPGTPLRNELERLSNANGNVSSGIGWHARKMEILHGCGMLGREYGLYGAVSFAYQG